MLANPDNAVLIFIIVFLLICTHHLSKKKEYVVAMVPAALAWILLWSDFPVIHRLVAEARTGLGLSGPLGPLLGGLIFLAIVCYAMKLMLVGDK